MNCPLCQNKITKRQEEISGVLFLSCSQCGSLFKHKRHWLTKEEEKARYEKHENDITNLGYQKFVQPIVSEVKSDFKPTANGLDFGAGTGPVISEMLAKDGYKLKRYDPFFYPEKSVLELTYDFIVCCEVMEHFFDPKKEFELLYKLLNQGGKLYCMTELIPETPLKDWHYQRDPTHVIFYSEENIHWIKKQYVFTKVTIDDRLIVFEK